MTERRRDPAQIWDLIRSVTRMLYAEEIGRPVLTAEIREAVLVELKSLSQVTQIRYALSTLGSRGRDGFVDARDFRRWLADEYPSVRSDTPPGDLSKVVDVRTGNRDRFSRDKVKQCALAALVGRGNTSQLERLASDVTNHVVDALITQPIVTTEQIAAEILRALRDTDDDIAYLRFASERKQFENPMDFEGEARALSNEKRGAATGQRT